MSIIDNSTDEEIRIKVNQKRIDAMTARRIKELCSKQIGDSPRDMHLDLSEVSYMNSSGIGNLLYIRQALKKHGKDLYVDRATDQLRSLFQELQLHDYFIIDGM